MSRTRPFLTLAAPLAVAAIVLAGCSSGGSSDAPAATADASASAGGSANANGNANGNGQRGQMGGGGTSGQIAQVGDATMQVRGTDGQTTVTWTGDTTFSATSTAKLTDVTVGSCVVAISGGMRGAPSDDASTGTGTGTADAAVSTIAISAATDGTCTAGGFGGGFGGRGTPGQRPSGAPTDMPSGAPGDSNGPTDRPTGAAGGRGGFGGFTSGKVTAVSGTSITVDATDQNGDTSSKTVTVGDSTTYTTTAKASAKALAVGTCATVQGKTDTKGAVAATRVVLSPATDGECSTGFGGGFGGRGPGGQGAGQSDDASQGATGA